MNNSSNKNLTTNELMFTLIGCIIGVGILNLPNSVVAEAKQDGWIASLMGGIYPLYVVLISSIIIKRYPEDNIMSLSKIFFGRFFGNFLNFLFMAQFMLYIIGVAGGAISILRVYAVWFMTPFKITLVLGLLVSYACTKGLKTIAKLNILSFFIVIIIISASVTAFKYGTLLNVQPFLQAPVGQFYGAFLQTLFSYGNMELLLILHPLVKNKGTIIRTALVATGIITAFYTWTVFVSTYYLGPDIVPKSLWPFFLVSESIKIPVITSFRFFYMALWTFVIFKTITTEYYAATTIFNNIFEKVDFRLICLIFSPVIIFLPLLFANEVARRAFFGNIIPWVTLYNLTYITGIAILAAIVKKRIKPC